MKHLFKRTVSADHNHLGTISLVVFLCSICLRLSVLRPVVVCCLTPMRPDRQRSARAGRRPRWGPRVHVRLGGKPPVVYAVVQTCESPSNPVSPPTRACKQDHRCPSGLPPMAEVRKRVVLWGVPLCQMPSVNKQGALTGGLVCIPTYPSRRTQSRCPPPPTLQRNEEEGRACSWLLLTQTSCSSNSL